MAPSVPLLNALPIFEIIKVSVVKASRQGFKSIGKYFEFPLNRKMTERVNYKRDQVHDTLCHSTKCPADIWGHYGLH